MLATRCPPAALLLQEIKEWPYLDAAASAPRGIAAAEEESRAAYGGGIQQDAGGRAAALAACAPAAVWRAAADVSPSPSRHITAQAGVAVQPWTHSPPNLTPPPPPPPPVAAAAAADAPIAKPYVMGKDARAGDKPQSLTDMLPDWVGYSTLYAISAIPVAIGSLVLLLLWNSQFH